IYILTADTFGTVREMVSDLTVEVAIIKGEDGSGFKRDFIKKIGSDETIAIGNGNNDRLMLEEAAIGIALIGNEGAATDTILNSDLIISNIHDVFDILEEPARLIASLRK
ncbi:MAG: HAD hydrolase family protein, partial [Halanaerobiaceae bacterium]